MENITFCFVHARTLVMRNDEIFFEETTFVTKLIKERNYDEIFNRQNKRDKTSETNQVANGKRIAINLFICYDNAYKWPIVVLAHFKTSPNETSTNSKRIFD